MAEERHADIIAKLEKATGLHNMGLNAYVVNVLGGEAMQQKRGWRSRALWWDSHPSYSGWHSLEDYQGSADAAIRLATEVMRGKIGPISIVVAGSAQATLESRDPCGWSVQAVGNDAAKAVLIALFKALDAQ